MSRILLITPTNRIHAERQNWSSPHLGVWRIAGYLERHGHTAEVWDTILDDSAPPVRGWDIIGFSLTHDTLPDDLSLMRRMASKYPDAILVAGGVEASTNWQQIMEHIPQLQYVILAEGEAPMLALADGMDEVKEIGHAPPTKHVWIAAAISRSHDWIGETELMEYNFSMPFERMRHREHWAITRSLRPRATPRELYCVRLNTSTFCNKACKFCSITHVHRMASGEPCAPITMPGDATKELIRIVLRSLPETQTIYFHDDDFCVFEEKVSSFFDDPPPLEYHVQARPDVVSLEMLQHMAQGGCKRVSYGIEAVVPHLLKDVGKGTTVEQSINAVEWTLKAKMEPVVLIILFCPTISMPDLAQTYRQLKAWTDRGIVLSIMSYIRPYHGSWYLRSGLHEIEWERVLGIKRPKAVLPDDPDVRALWRTFEERVADAEKRITHHWKGRMSVVMVEVLGQLLKERRVT